MPRSSGTWRLFLLLIMLAVLFAEAAGRRKKCPRVQEKVERRINNCYNPLFSSYDPDDPVEFCGVYQYVLACVEGWIERCSHRPWMASRRQELDAEINWMRTVLDSQCTDVQ